MQSKLYLKWSLKLKIAISVRARLHPGPLKVPSFNGIGKLFPRPHRPYPARLCVVLAFLVFTFVQFLVAPLTIFEIFEFLSTLFLI